MRRLYGFLTHGFPHSFRMVIADNASDDRTPKIARRLTDEMPELRYVRLDEKGRGRGLRHVWSRSEAEVVCYIDVDLSTGLELLAPLVEPLLAGQSRVGDRDATGAGVSGRQGPQARADLAPYNRILQLTLHTRVSDAQCGFKALHTETARTLLPLVEDQAWFFTQSY